MGKPKGSRDKYVSSGKGRSSIRTRMMQTPSDKFMNKVDALKKGKDVWMTIDNPDPIQTNKRTIRVKISGNQWGKRLAASRAAERIREAAKTKVLESANE